jgi:hypothetical protein
MKIIELDKKVVGEYVTSKGFMVSIATSPDFAVKGELIDYYLGRIVTYRNTEYKVKGIEAFAVAKDAEVANIGLLLRPTQIVM